MPGGSPFKWVKKALSGTNTQGMTSRKRILLSIVVSVDNAEVEVLKIPLVRHMKSNNDGHYFALGHTTFAVPFTLAIF